MGRGHSALCSLCTMGWPFLIRTCCDGLRTRATQTRTKTALPAGALRHPFGRPTAPLGGAPEALSGSAQRRRTLPDNVRREGTARFLNALRCFPQTLACPLDPTNAHTARGQAHRSISKHRVMHPSERNNCHWYTECGSRDCLPVRSAQALYCCRARLSGALEVTGLLWHGK